MPLESADQYIEDCTETVDRATFGALAQWVRSQSDDDDCRRQFAAIWGLSREPLLSSHVGRERTRGQREVREDLRQKQ